MTRYLVATWAVLCVAPLSATVAIAGSGHLWWNNQKLNDAVCIYGEITVLATQPGMYFCGANWHPGEAAGGYCGIQDIRNDERRTIFSIWDTAPNLHPRVSEADAKTVVKRFGGEGTGAHSHMIWPWKVGQVYQFFVRKQPGEGDTTDTRYYCYDPQQKAWIHAATISSPNGGKRSATTTASVVSFLENFSGREPAAPKLALYRLWLGVAPDQMKCLTRADGDGGPWGRLGEAYFMAQGDQGRLHDVFAGVAKQYGEPTFAGPGKKIAPLADKPLAAELIQALKQLPQAPRVPQ